MPPAASLHISVPRSDPLPPPPSQSVAGATATATHGTGIGYPTLSSLILEAELITASGEVLTVSATVGAAARWGLHVYPYDVMRAVGCTCTNVT